MEAFEIILIIVFIIIFILTIKYFLKEEAVTSTRDTNHEITDNVFINKILMVADTIKDEKHKFVLLESIIGQLDDIEQALSIANIIKSHEEKAQALASIVKKNR
jgi:hypothetical protein